MNYGVQHRYYARPLQGWPPGQFPLGHWGIGSLGQAPVPTGSTVQYTATWTLPDTNVWASGASYQIQTPSSMAAQLLANVVQILKQNASSNGLQVLSSSVGSLASILSTTFSVTINLLVSGPGFSQPNDAGSFVDSAYVQASGNEMPTSASVMTSTPSGTAQASVPISTTYGAQVPVPSQCPQGDVLDSSGNCVGQTTSWLESNAWWLVLAGAAAIAIPRLL